MKEAIRTLAEAVNRLADALLITQTPTEKGEKEKSPHTPLKGKDPKRKTINACARASEQANFERLFAEFWDAYPTECPRKVGKSKCREKYISLMRKAEEPSALHAAILAGIGRWRLSHDWNEKGGEFIKAPLVFLNHENWLDSPAPFSPSIAVTPLQRAAEERERARELQTVTIQANAIAALTERDWELCRESGCRHCGESGGCRAGITLPPDHRLNYRPCHPVECPHFLAEEGGAI